MKVGVYPMVADILHTGHILAIEEAKKHCDYLIVALHCCPDYKQPVQSIYERFMQLRAVKWVDEVIPYENKKDAAILLQSLDYDVYFLGEDYKGKDWENSDLIKSLNKEIFFLSRKHTFSSTNLKIRIVDKEMNIND
ncbi:adenylyltransferase/cytidyltransferase family protein [Methanosphaera sp.]|uniref:adenylyltransferase/cytidyltransferase family protein n=1 Tax=Methanosphaera sp. TaxID=2666342 RepID=UPI0025EA7BC2|nr:adenylyltransferase/cytidyltransferase family protein [Methanosphaera sp.]